MSIRTKFILIFGSLFLVVTFFAYYSIVGMREIDLHVKQHVPDAIKTIQTDSKLDITAQLIHYNDEVLTQSARNYAFTGEAIWKVRYDEYAPKLDLRIKEALELGDSQDKAIFDSINEANLALVDLETAAIASADNGELSAAQMILDSTQYTEQKNIYKAGIDKFLLKRGSAFNKASVVSIKELEADNLAFIRIMTWQRYGTMGFVVLFFVAMIFIMWQIIATFMMPLNIFKTIAKKITGGDLSAKVDIKTKNEIGEFAQDFNKMTSTIKESQENIEAKIAERTADLEKLNKFMTGREIKMIELKKKIEELEGDKNGHN
jgi:nitrogen fixation/metabolism regulation signal transduction histidine kinase